ncbi:phenylacetyl-CoA ligase-like protein, partial [Aureobasidium pullulans]
SWAVHRLSGISSPANSAYGVSELETQIQSSRSKAVFTCVPLLQTALKAAGTTGAPVSCLSSLWLICYADWDIQKGVIVSHKNVIANVLQLDSMEKTQRYENQHDVVLGLLPQSHIYGLVVIYHASVYRGDSIIVLPKFHLSTLGEAIETFRINVLFVVPPMIMAMLSSKKALDRYNLTSVTEIFSGGAPLASEACDLLHDWYPSWAIRQGYGMTEAATAISATLVKSQLTGSAGCLLPGVQARIVSSTDGADITEFGKSGELLIRSPSVTRMGYMDNHEATRETFGEGEDGWLRTGDEAMFLVDLNSRGHQHLFIVDRLKELIKVKGYQVAPAELESCLLTHPLVKDVAVIPVADSFAGELPKAVVVLDPDLGLGQQRTHSQTAECLEMYVRERKAHYKWLAGGVEFVDSIPRSQSGKILRRVLLAYQRARPRGHTAML